MSPPQLVSRANRGEISQSASDYEYSALPSGRYSRYFVLQSAAEHDEPLACTLHTAPLDDFPHFEAISYVWGTPVANKTMSCNGKLIHLTTNLFDALLQVRLTGESRTLWADSICINQDDLEERAHQVSLINHIYERSDCTLICLGLSGHSRAQSAARLVSEVDQMIQTVFDRKGFHSVSNSFPFPNESEPLLSHQGWHSFGDLLQQPWFDRGWVVQEAALSPYATVLWAGSEIDWFKLLRVYIWRIRRALMLPSHQSRISNLHLRGFYARRPQEATAFFPEAALAPSSLLETLDSARWLGVTDPRDRIYAFLNLVKSTQELPKIRPSYTATPLQVYHGFAAEYLKVSRDLDMLHFVHHDHDTLNSGHATWVPRWDISLYGNRTSNLNNYHGHSLTCFASRHSPHEIGVSSDQTTLELRAMFIDTISYTAQSFHESSTSVNDVISIWNDVSKQPTDLAYSCGNLQAFITTFRCGVYRGRLKEWQAFESAYMRLLELGLSKDDILDDGISSFHQDRMGDLNNKRFIVTGRGQYGLAPEVAQKGDICCIIFGTKSPFILRKTGQSNHYRLIGSALVLSNRMDHNGNPEALYTHESYCDWEEYAVQEETIFLI